MAKRRPDDHNLIADINITPFIDVVLVLLIIFMITTALLIQAGMKMDMPGLTKQTAPGENEEAFITVSISADDSIFLDNQKYPINEIKPILQQLMRLDPKSIVAINGSPEASYETVVQVVDIARAAGVSKYVLTR